MELLFFFFSSRRRHTRFDCDWSSDVCSSDLVAAVEDTARLCAELGHELVEVTPSELDGDAITVAFIDLWCAGQAWTMQHWSRRTGRPLDAEDFEPLTWALYEMGLSRTSADYLSAVEQLQRVSRQVAAYFRGLDAWLTPTLAEPPPQLGSFDCPPDNPMFGLLHSATYVPFTPIANITGQPAMSVPLSWNQAGLPVGSHFMGRFGDEATLFRL